MHFNLEAILSQLQYSENDSNISYSDQPIGEFNPDRYIEGKKPFQFKKQINTPKNKTIIVTDWQWRYLNQHLTKEEIKIFFNKNDGIDSFYKFLLENDFNVYAHTETELINLKQCFQIASSAINTKRLKKIFLTITPIKVSDAIKLAKEQKIINREEEAIVLDPLTANELFNQAWCDIGKSIHHYLPLVIDDEFEEGKLNIIDAIKTLDLNKIRFDCCWYIRKYDSNFTNTKIWKEIQSIIPDLKTKIKSHYIMQLPYKDDLIQILSDSKIELLYFASIYKHFYNLTFSSNVLPKTLKKINLSNSNINAKDLTYLLSNVYLEELDLSDCQKIHFDDLDFNKIPPDAFKHLKYLNLSFTNINKQQLINLLSLIGMSSRLEYLNISYCNEIKLSQLTPEKVSAAAKNALQNLKRLDFKGLDPQQLNNIWHALLEKSCLENLSIEFKDLIPLLSTNNSHLEVLELTNGSINLNYKSIKSLPKKGALNKLRFLKVTNAEIKFHSLVNLLSWLGENNSLKALIFEQCEFYDINDIKSYPQISLNQVQKLSIQFFEENCWQANENCYKALEYFLSVLGNNSNLKDLILSRVVITDQLNTRRLSALLSPETKIHINTPQPYKENQEKLSDTSSEDGAIANEYEINIQTTQVEGEKFLCTQYFPDIDPDNYRLEIFEIKKNNDGTFTQIEVTEANRKLVDYKLPNQSENKQLFTGRYTIDKLDEWIRLRPSISAAEKLIRCHADQKVILNFQYNETNNFFYVNASAKDNEVRLPINLEYQLDIPEIKLKYSGKPTIELEKFQPILVGLIKKYEQYNNVDQPLIKLERQSEFINNLIYYCSNFTPGELIGVSKKSSNLEKIKAILLQMKGACQQRANAFYWVMKYLLKNNSCRIIDNDCHRYIEIEGQKIDLGGFAAELERKTLPKVPNKSIDESPLTNKDKQSNNEKQTNETTLATNKSEPVTKQSENKPQGENKPQNENKIPSNNNLKQSNQQGTSKNENIVVKQENQNSPQNEKQTNKTTLATNKNEPAVKQNESKQLKLERRGDDHSESLKEINPFERPKFKIEANNAAEYVKILFAKVEKNLNSSPTSNNILIVYTDHSHAGDLKREIKAQIGTKMIIEYINTPDDFRLMGNRIGADEIQKVPSPLKTILKFSLKKNKQHLLVIDWTKAFSPNQISSYKSILDEVRKIENQEAGNKLIVINLLPKQREKEIGKDVYSRCCQHIYDYTCNTENNNQHLFENIKQPPENSIIAKFYWDNTDSEDTLEEHVKQVLLGTTCLTNGKIIYHNGALIEAIEKSKPLVLQNYPWHSERCNNLLQKIQDEQKVFCNGNYYQYTNQGKWLHQTIQPIWNEQCTIQYLSTTNNKSAASFENILNSQLEHLFLGTHLPKQQILPRNKDNKLSQWRWLETITQFKSLWTPLFNHQDQDNEPYKLQQFIGIIEQYKNSSLDVLVTHNIAAATWTKILEHAKKHHCRINFYLADKVTVPQYAPIKNITSSIQPLESLETKLNRYSGGLFINTSDIYGIAAVEKIICQSVKAKVIAINNTQSFANLTKRIHSKDFKNLLNTFALKTSDVLRLLLNGENVILKGPISPELVNSLETMFLAKPFLWVNGKKIHPKGKLYIITDSKVQCGIHEASFTFKQLTHQIPKPPTIKPLATNKEKVNGILNILEKKPICIIEGESGIGKSYSVEHLSTENKNIKICFSIKEWLKTLPQNGALVVLVVDEANTQEDGKWYKFEGLFAEQPTYLYQEKLYRLTKQHKVVFPLNPTSYSGRKEHAFLESHQDCKVYFILNTTSLLEALAPLFTLDMTSQEKALCAKIFLMFYNFSKIKFPQHTFSMRTIHTMMLHYRCLRDNKTWVQQQPSDTAIKILAIKAAYDFTLRHLAKNPLKTLDKLIIKQKILPSPDNLVSELINFQDNLTKEKSNKFEKYNQLKGNSSFVFTAEHEGLLDTMEDILVVNNLRIQHPKLLPYGAKITSIQGPSGIGKSTFLKLVLKVNGHKEITDLKKYQPQKENKVFYQVTAGQLNPIDVELAHEKGVIVVEDEANLDIKKEKNCNLNKYLDDNQQAITKHPGFMFMTTYNKVDYGGGRKEIPKSTDSRTININLGNYSQQALIEIMINKYPQVPAEKIIKKVEQFVRAQTNEINNNERLPLTFRDLNSYIANLAGNISVIVNPNALIKHPSTADGSNVAEVFDSKRLN